MKPDETWHWLELWERARDHALTAEEQTRLNDALRQNPEVRTLLAQAALMDAEMRVTPADALLGKATPPLPRKAFSLSSKVSRFVLPIAAAIVSAGAVWLIGREPTPVATLTKANDCKWGNSALPTLEGSSLQPGMLELLDGIATLKFASGAEVALEAPVTLEVISAMECRVKKGTVVAEVPQQAKGFTIHTAETKVVDYGTRFGISAGEDGKCLVHVIEGLVEVERKGEKGRKELRAGQRVDYGGFIKSASYPDAVSQDDQPEPGRWLPGPINNLGDGWQILTTAFGRGKDSWIQSNLRQRVTGRESYLRIKHTTHDESLDRKAYVAFDLSRFTGKQIAEAEFTLHVEPSDLGFASLVPDAVFTVYGLTDETQDAWSENEISWSNAPAHSLATEHRISPVEGQATKLGQFIVPQGTTRGAFTMKGEALANFLCMDSNGMATFIIIRETDETARNGLAHAFASKENTRNTPPMLKVRVEE
ncbi:FecR family protein [Prosthecobacter fusiformis]|uniref:FecR family protein n=1 Tax=Prosthecobacter fusiformis TaxID=48464 RepID=A0A4R7S293_9BACT|nr:DNRLRE domain-containing protein [Prosthecobacter fusiformis]TDU71365.1 FecR family protein [Prosthecobacter fusiformis]